MFLLVTSTADTLEIDKKEEEEESEEEGKEEKDKGKKAAVRNKSCGCVSLLAKLYVITCPAYDILGRTIFLTRFDSTV